MTTNNITIGLDLGDRRHAVSPKRGQANTIVFDRDSTDLTLLNSL